MKYKMDDRTTDAPPPSNFIEIKHPRSGEHFKILYKDWTKCKYAVEIEKAILKFLNQ
jgi:hypothetical protein